MGKEKYVDESWKEQASQEKDTLADSGIQQSGDEKNIINKTENIKTIKIGNRIIFQSSK